jgi:hypothetical protein
MTLITSDDTRVIIYNGNVFIIQATGAIGLASLTNELLAPKSTQQKNIPVICTEEKCYSIELRKLY